VTSGGGAARRSYLSYLEALLAACLWGSSGIFAVNLFRRGVPPDSVALLRPVIGGTLLAAGLAVVRPGALRIDGRGLLVVGLGGGVAVGLFQIAYQRSIDAIGVPITVALVYLAPALVALIAGPLLGEWPNRRRLALVAVTVLGVWLTVLGADAEGSSFGLAELAWGFLGAVTYASYTLIGRYGTPRHGAFASVVYSMAAACVILAVAIPLTSGPVTLPPTPEAWFLLVVFSILTIALAQLLFFDALRRVEASGASVAASVEPVVAALRAATLLDQNLSAIGWIGIALVVAGVAGVGLTSSTS
jgi:drug/metabolite transporter (DMT)-like permease